MSSPDSIADRALCLVAALLLVALTAGCEQEPAAALPIPVVSVYEVGPAQSERNRQFYGRVVPADLTKVAFRIPGKIELLAVQAGQNVVAGEVLAKIESSIQEQALADAQAQYQLSKRQLQRANNLLDIGAITPARKDELNASFRLAQANLKLAEAMLSYTLVKAPFTGTVVDVDKEVFESVMPGETIASVYRNDRVDVLINIPDGLPARIHQAEELEGYQPIAVFTDRPGEYAMSHLKHTTARNPELEAFQIWVTMPVPQTPIPPGVPATISVDLESAGFEIGSGLVVPLSALQAGSEPEQFRVWRYQRGAVDPVAVTIARVSRDGALLSGGVQAGDIIVTSGLSALKPGQPVNIAPRDQDS